MPLRAPGTYCITLSSSPPTSPALPCLSPLRPPVLATGRAQHSSRGRSWAAFALYHLLGPSFARRVLHSHAGAACTPSRSPVSLSSRAEWPAASWATPPGGPQALRSQPLLSSLATRTPSRSKALSCIYPHVIFKNPSMPLSPQAPPCPRASTPSSASLQPAVTGLGQATPTRTWASPFLLSPHYVLWLEQPSENADLSFSCFSAFCAHHHRS